MGIFQNNLMGAAAAAASAGGGEFYDYQIANSLRFDGSSSVLTKTWGSSATSDDKFAISVWVKAHKTDGTWGMIASAAQNDSMGLYVGARYDSDAHSIGYYAVNGANNAASLAYGRDSSAWRHIVWIYDSTQSSGPDRIKIYNNGEHWIAGSSAYWGDIEGNGYPSQNADMGWGKNGNANEIGRYQYNGEADYYGYMADFITIDGPASISDFGETKNGVWIPKDPSGLTFGNNGFHLNFASSGDLGNDVSGNNNDWSIAGLSAHDQMLDSPTFNSDSNGGNFATWNFLSRTNPALSYGASTFSEGNLGFAGATGGTASTGSTISMQSGKWYAEVMQSGTPNGGFPALGVIYTNRMGSAQGTSNIQPQNGFTSFIAQTNGNIYKFNGSSGASYGRGFGSGDLCNIAGDINAGKIWWGKNGT